MIVGAVLGLVAVVAAGWFLYDLRATYGPLTYGSARWRREAPLREARQAHRVLVDNLEPADRAWLIGQGWTP